MSEKLRALSVETLGIVATNAERARLYLRYHPTRLPLAADPNFATHRAYGLPQMDVTPELVQAVRAVKINPTGELPTPMDALEAGEALNRVDRFEMTKTDEEDNGRQGVLFGGQFLVDHKGILRWANVECAKEGPAGFGKFLNEEELLAAARGL